MGSDHSTAEGARRDVHKKRETFSCALAIRPVKVGWQCGQHAKDSIRYCWRQAWEMTIVLK